MSAELPPLSDAELARIEELATAAHDYGGDEQELGELALELVAEVRAAREREATGLLDRREYAVARPASMPDMSGRERYTMIVGATFPTWEQADNARRRVPALRDSPTVIVSRIAPGSDGEEDDDQ